VADAGPASDRAKQQPLAGGPGEGAVPARRRGGKLSGGRRARARGVAVDFAIIASGR